MMPQAPVSGKMLARLVEAADDCVLFFAADGRLLYANVAASRRLGHRRGDLHGLHVRDLVHPASLSAFEAAFSTLSDGTAERCGPMRLRFLRRDHGVVWLEVVTSTVHDADGSPLGVQASARPPAAGSAEETGWSRFAQAAPLGLFTCDRRGRLHQANGRALRMLGLLRPHDARLTALLEDPAALEEVWERSHDAPAVFEAAVVVEGTPRWLRWHVTRGHDGEDSQMAYVVVEDVAMQHHLRQSGDQVAVLADAVRGAPDLDAGLAVLVRGLCRLAGWAYGEAWRPDGTRLVASEAWWSADPARTGRFRRLSRQQEVPAGSGPLGQAWQEQVFVGFEDVHHGPGFPLASLAHAVGLEAGVAVPVVDDGKTLAVLLFLDGGGPLDPHWSAVAASLGTHLGALVGQRADRGLLRQRVRLLQGVLDAAPDPAAVVAEDGRLLAVNAAMLRLAGVRRAERPSDIMEPFDGLPGLQDVVAALYEGSLSSSGHVTVRGRVFQRRQQRLLDTDDLPLGVALWCRDVTEPAEALRR